MVALIQAAVSLRRINRFIDQPETAKYSEPGLKYVEYPTHPTVGFVHGSFSWSDEVTAERDSTVFRIKDLNLDFPVGKLSLIYGAGEHQTCYIAETGGLS